MMHSVLLVAVVGLVTLALRAAPFLILGGDRKSPEFISYLGRVLPAAMMGLLVVYCLKSVDWRSAPYGAAELLSVAAVVILHKWKDNVLLSIAGGTALYMVLVQAVFA